MSDGTKLVYLASYPKSGNTWLRIFLGYLLYGENGFEINKVGEFAPITSSRVIFEEATGENSFELSKKEISYYLPKVIKYYASQTKCISFLKTHEAYLKDEYNQWKLPQDIGIKAVYLIRNPLDICVSYAHHIGQLNYGKVIETMSDEKLTTLETTKQLPQFFSSWSNHILSWKENFPKQRILFVKYEDMVRFPQETFQEIVDFIGLEHDVFEINAAIEKSSFVNLQKKEKELGFKERSLNSDCFFRKGKIGSWKDELSNRQSDKIIHDHVKVMKQFKYID